MKNKHLTMDERYQIKDLLSQGFSQNKIAKHLKRSPSTVSRELKRNKGKQAWHPNQAHKKAKKRLQKRGLANVRKVNETALAYARHHLIVDQWSPQQIAERLKLEERKSISHEWLYQWILADKKQGGSLYQHLRCQKQRRRRYGSSRRCCPKIPDRIGIEERPCIVDRRERVGDWEGDTIVGAGCNSGAIVSSVERVSRLTLLAKVDNKQPATVTKAMIRIMSPVKGITHTLTLDNGGEFASHQEVSEALDLDVYFARPYHSWERGTNENTNGLVRQYAKKKMRFDNLTDEEVQRIEDKLNNRPRKCLGYKTPNEVFNETYKSGGVAFRI